MSLLSASLNFTSLSIAERLSGAFQPYFALHIPDGYLSPPILAVTWVLVIGLIAIALKRVQSEYQDRAVPLMGVCSAFIFAAQMVSFPIPGGTSGHLLGGTLVGALLGPWAGSLVMAVVFFVQAAIFQDGGVLAMGANIFNMGLIGTFGGYYLFQVIRQAIGNDRLRGMMIGSAIAAWISVVLAAIITAFQLSLSGTVGLAVALPAMVGWHLLIGIGEALITAYALAFVWRTRPDLFYRPPNKPLSRTRSLTSR
jgi:cobalt/nickel transport system permease protein